MEVDVSSSLKDTTSDQITVVKAISENLRNKKVTNGTICGINRSDDDKKADENCIFDANDLDPVVVENSEEENFEDKKMKNYLVCENNSPDDVNKSGEKCMPNETNLNSINIKCSGEVQHKLKKLRPGKRDREALRLNGQSKCSGGVGTKVNAVAAAENDTTEPGSTIVDSGPNLVGGTVANSCTELLDSKRIKINEGKQHSCTDTDTGRCSTSSTLETECRPNSKYCSSEKLVSTEGVAVTGNSADLGGAVAGDSTDLPGNATTESDTDLESQKRKTNNRMKKKKSNDGTANEVICVEGSAENKQTTTSPIRSGTETTPMSDLVTTETVLSGSCPSNTLVPKILVSSGKKKLLVLDINGLLADINSDFRYTEHADFKISGKLVFKRPFCTDFLNFCFANFEIGIWSSRKKYNVDKAVEYLMGGLRNQLLFCWDQSKCTATNFNTIDNSCKPLVFKELKKLWENEEPDLPWEKGRFTPSNTLLVDDSPYKAFCNPPFTAIFPPPYSFKHKEDNSLGIGGDLRVYLEKVATAEHVQYYVKDNPFGQPAITDSHPNWKFYLRIIENLDKPLGSS